MIFRIFAGVALVLGHNSERIHCKDGKGFLIQLLQLGPRATDSTIMYYNNMQGPLVYNLRAQIQREVEAKDQKDIIELPLSQCTGHLFIATIG